MRWCNFRLRLAAAVRPLVTVNSRADIPAAIAVTMTVTVIKARQGQEARDKAQGARTRTRTRYGQDVKDANVHVCRYSVSDDICLQCK
jgi:hypothetical protein